MCLLESFSEKGAGKRLPSGLDGETMLDFQNEPIKMILNGLYHRRMICGREIVECPVLEKRGLTADELLSWKRMDFRAREMNRSEQRKRDDLELTKKTVAGLEKTVQRYKSGSWEKFLGVKRRESSASGGYLKSEKSSPGNSLMRNKDGKR